jgi:hypothetical protein
MRRPPFVWYFISWVLGLANVFLGIGALCWVAMWLGWQARTHARAVVWTVAIAKGLPFLVATLAPGLLYVLLNILTPLGTGGPGMPIAYTVSSWIPQLFITLFYGWLIREAKHALLLAVASNPPGTFSWLQYLLQMRRETALSLRKARHWTPSS